MSGVGRARGVWLPVAVWAVTRAVVLLCVLRVLVLPGPDVTTDVSVIYQGWSGILKTGTFPLADVTWQYPPAAALAILSPGLLPFLDYAPAFFTLILVTDAAALLHYGSLEFLGPGVPFVSTLALTLSLGAVGWLFLWRVRAREFGPATLCDAAFTATLLFTTTSRVISPQYMLWLVGLAAVCVTVRASRQALPAVLVLLATGVTLLEFPVWFADVVASEPRGVALLVVRNGLLVAASLLACRRLWVATRGTGHGRTEPVGVVSARRPVGETTAATGRLTRHAPQEPADGPAASGR
ncbi:hypothetical protein ACFVJH_35380 [Streptomyces decoyicus]|uniref:hypothetical protein n=1 Tax=Streptomyces decoyicus TaxID=249567 RepID=UPI00363C42CD